MRLRPLCVMLALPALALARPAAAVDACDIPPRYGVEATAASIVQAACQEHRLWLRPFIDRDGRLASLAVTEAERARLDDGSTPAWQQVARYWRESGTLSVMGAAPGADSCMATPGERFRDSDCRAFLLDNPWSAAFISWVMRRAGVSGFLASPRHMDYIAHAWRQPERSPYTYADPFTGKPAPGDLLCFLRAADEGRGADGLRAALSGQGSMPRQSHCEVVIAANPGGDRTLHLVGGNTLNAVVMRQLPLERDGRLARATASGVADAGCGPGLPGACDFNRRDWAVLLKLKPQAQLGLPGVLEQPPHGVTVPSADPTAPAEVD